MTTVSEIDALRKAFAKREEQVEQVQAKAQSESTVTMSVSQLEQVIANAVQKAVGQSGVAPLSSIQDPELRDLVEQARMDKSPHANEFMLKYMERVTQNYHANKELTRIGMGQPFSPPTRNDTGSPGTPLRPVRSFSQNQQATEAIDPNAQK